MQQNHKKAENKPAGARSQGTEPSPLLLVPLAHLMKSVSWGSTSHSSAPHPSHSNAACASSTHTKQGKYPKWALGMVSPGTCCTQDLHPSPHTGHGQEQLRPAAREGGGRRFNSCPANNLYITLKNFPRAFPARLPFTIPLINSGEN